MNLHLGTALKVILTPFTWVLYWISFGRADFRNCGGCKQRADYLNKLFGN